MLFFLLFQSLFNTNNEMSPLYMISIKYYRLSYRVIVGEVHFGSNEGYIGVLVDVRLADTGVQQWRLETGVRADQKYKVRFLHI